MRSLSGWIVAARCALSRLRCAHGPWRRRFRVIVPRGAHRQSLSDRQSLRRARGGVPGTGGVRDSTDLDVPRLVAGRQDNPDTGHAGLYRATAVAVLAGDDVGLGEAACRGSAVAFLEGES